MGSDRRLLRLAIALSLLAFVTSCARSRSIPPPSAKTPVILISIDTLRSDHLPAYGYAGVATPHIDALRADSILYERAYSHVPLTLPSHVSILTGMLPADNGVRDNVGFRVSAATPMLQELLHRNGYATGAAVSTYVLRRETLLARGFDFYDDSVLPLDGPAAMGRLQRDGGDTVRSALQWLDGVAARPFFLFVHLYEPHTPYEPPEPYRSRYADRYDGEIAYSDELVGRVIAALKEKNLYDDALIVLLSDHGEGLDEHGEEEHGFFLYREALQVPLLVKLPHAARANASVAVPVGLVDVFPTILERTATPRPGHAAHSGQSLLSFLDGGLQRPIYAETSYARFHYGWSDLHSLIDGNQHYIQAPQPELYDLSSDPAEKTNTITAQRRTYARLRSAIAPMIRESAAPSAVDAETSAKLAALGYVGSAATPSRGGALPDPKSMMGTYRDIRRAFSLSDRNELAESLQVTGRLLADNGQITDLWDLKSKTLYKLGRHREALDAAREGLRRVPGAQSLLFDVASVAMALGELEMARQHAEAALTIEPGRAHELLARIALLQRDPARAQHEANLAVPALQDPRKALLLLGSMAMDRQRYEEALAHYDRAAQYEGAAHVAPLPNLHLDRGNALARLGRFGEAEAEWRQEIAAFPVDARVYPSLLAFLVAQHRQAEAARLVLDAVNASPRPRTYAVLAETLRAVGDRRAAVLLAQQGTQRFPQSEELRQLATP